MEKSLVFLGIIFVLLVAPSVSSENNVPDGFECTEYRCTKADPSLCLADSSLYKCTKSQPSLNCLRGGVRVACGEPSPISAASIASNLDANAASSGTTTIITEGDSYKFEKTSTKFHLGDPVIDIKTNLDKPAIELNCTFGDIQNETYCNKTHSYINQSNVGKNCTSSFECKSNFCFNNECLESIESLLFSFQNRIDSLENSLFEERQKNILLMNELNESKETLAIIEESQRKIEKKQSGITGFFMRMFE